MAYQLKQAFSETVIRVEFLISRSIPAKWTCCLTRQLKENPCNSVTWCAVCVCVGCSRRHGFCTGQLASAISPRLILRSEKWRYDLDHLIVTFFTGRRSIAVKTHARIARVVFTVVLPIQYGWPKTKWSIRLNFYGFVHVYAAFYAHRSICMVFV